MSLMSFRVILFAVWCLMLIAGSAYTSYYAWSPFAAGQRPDRALFFGPNHK